MRRKLSGFAVLSLAWAPFAAAPAASVAQERAGVQAQSTTAGAESGRAPGANETERAAGGPQAAEEMTPDLAITARVTAASLVFRKVPNPKVEFTGRPRRETVWEADRTNLPEEVRPGVTYRDVGITLRITSVFADIDRIVAEALGEIPAAEDAQPSQPAEPQGQTPPQPIAARDSPSAAEGRSRNNAAPRSRTAARRGRAL